MGAYLHKIQVPVYLAESFGKSDKEHFNRFSFSYIKSNYPEFTPVTIMGEPQDPHKQKGLILCTYQAGLSPQRKKEVKQQEAAAREKDKKRRAAFQ